MAAICSFIPGSVNMRSFCALVLLTGLASCMPSVPTCGKSWFALSPENDRIVYGENATKGAWPWMVSLSYRPWNKPDQPFEHKCGGAIINKDWIVTAGHCFTAKKILTDWKITSGEHELKTTEDEAGGPAATVHDLDELELHPDYKSPYKPGDIALVKVKQPFDLGGKFVQPICIPEKEDVFDEFDTSCYAAGWGDTQGTAENPNVLQQIQSEIFNLEMCIEEHDAVFDGVVHSDSICFGDGRKGTCTNDSGGPLMCQRDGRWILAGVTSWGNVYCQQLPGVFTRVAAYYDWIHDVTGGNP